MCQAVRRVGHDLCRNFDRHLVVRCGDRVSARCTDDDDALQLSWICFVDMVT